MPPFEKHIFICLNERSKDHPRGCCSAKGSEEIKKLFKKHIQDLGLKGRVRANTAGCLDHCEHGPTVVIYPEGTWYQVKTPEDVKEIMEQHVKGGNAVRRLAIYPDKL